MLLRPEVRCGQGSRPDHRLHLLAVSHVCKPSTSALCSELNQKVSLIPEIHVRSGLKSRSEPNVTYTVMVKSVITELTFPVFIHGVRPPGYTCSPHGYSNLILSSQPINCKFNSHSKCFMKCTVYGIRLDCQYILKCVTRCIWSWHFPRRCQS